MSNRLRWRERLRARDGWIVALFVLVVFVPAASVLWFTAQTAVTQSAAARQRVLDAYRGQLRLARSRIDAHWQQLASRLDGSGDPEAHFAQLIVEGAAEGAILLGPDGALAFPHPDERTQPTGNSRLVMAQQLLLLARRSVAGSPERLQRVDQLAGLLNDYTTSIPSMQRIALMGDLRALSPNVRLPTEAALRLSASLVALGPPAPTTGGFRPTPVPDVWAITSTDGRTIGLYRTGRLESMLHDLLHEVSPAGIRFVAFPPGVGGDAEAVAAGPSLPGWQLSFAPIDMAPFEAAARTAVVTSVAVGAASVALIIGLGAVAGGALRRRLRLARLKTDLVAAVSHELRTPVTSVGVLVENLLSDPAPDPARTREYLGLMAAENARLGRLIENFLTFARLEQHVHQFVFTPEAPSAIVAAALDAVRDRVPDGSLLQVDAPPDLPDVNVDREAVITALVNLLDNAIKYTQADKRITLHVRQDGRFLVFAVEDNGIGIPVREQRRIFQRFHRVDQRLARETEGVGLGLSIVDLIVRAHGGEVRVMSAPGEGSTFVVRLPCAEAPTAA